MSPVLLEVTNLRTQFNSARGLVRSVDGVSLTLKRGEVLALVGESGSGKSVTGLSLMGLIDAPGKLMPGTSIRFKGREIAGLPDRQMRHLRGREIAMIFQDPMMTLNPVLRVDTQMIEAVQAHTKIGRAEAFERSLSVLRRVGIPAPEDRLRCYPHELSGGMKQRVAIAIALLHAPDLIIADEPTTALDVTIQGQILAEVQALVAETGTALIWITHDLSVVAGLADRVAVMYAGRIVEEGPVDAVLDQSRHPYTQGLIDSIPSRTRPGERLRPIPGTVATPTALPTGCAFRDRCSHATAVCGQMPEMTTSKNGHRVRCHHPMIGEIAHAG